MATINPYLNFNGVERSMRAAEFSANPANFKAGCMVAASPIWTDITGTCCIWISAKCRNGKNKTAPVV